MSDMTVWMIGGGALIAGAAIGALAARRSGGSAPPPPAAPIQAAAPTPPPQPATALPPVAPAPAAADTEKLQAALDDVESLRSRLAQAEAALRDARRAPSAPAAAPAPTSAAPRAALRAMADEAHALRQRMALAEAALREARRGIGQAEEVAALKAEIARLSAGAPKSGVLADERRAFAAELDGLRARATQAETALRRLRIARG